jgi:hypothetical protein
MSPTVMLPLATPTAARHIINVTPTAMISDWPRLSQDSETWLRICAASHFCICSS